ncbi:MAG: PhoH family protein [Desulfovibrionaceae bacterium]
MTTDASESTTKRLQFEDSALANEVFGPQGRNLELIAEMTGVDIDSRGAAVTVRGETPQPVELAANVLAQAYELARSGRAVLPQDVDCAVRILSKEPHAKLSSFFCDAVQGASPKRMVSPKTVTQRDYLDAIRKFDLVFGVGPAGTGKTYLAVAMAVSALVKREVKRLVLTRPAVEAGEKLGFLPGDLADKVNPYLRPLYDALNDLLDYRKVQEMLQTNVIEIAPLAFMRGRTLNDAFVILDEAQNTTPEQMKMFLTRLGFGSRCVVTGDVTQIDLPNKGASGLVQARRILRNVKGVRFVEFGDEDVIRHPLVARIVGAYDRFEREGQERQTSSPRQSGAGKDSA